MTFANEHIPSSNGELDRLNEEGSEIASEATRRLCEASLTLAYGVLEYYLGKDHEAQAEVLSHDDSLTGKVYERYVLRDNFSAPRQDKEFMRTASVRLEPANGSDVRFMYLHLPADEAKIELFEMPNREEVTQLFIETHDAADTHWYAVNQSGLYEYIPYVQQDENTEILDDQGIWRWIDEKVPEGLSTISKLFTDMVNWHTVTQRSTTL